MLQNVIVILLVFLQHLPDAVHYHWVSYANVKKESMVEYAMSVESFTGTYSLQIQTAVKVWLNNQKTNDDVNY